jgi:prepilin-type N-terminal cleavage/methylation domain-containing protein
MYRHSPNRDFSSGFTLIELLVVIAIIAILAVVVILVLNPAELLRQSRDSSRLSDMATLTSALAIFATNNTSAGGLGSASTTYISIADATATSTVGDQCQGLGFSGLPTGDSYFCPASTTARVTSGTGWIPVNFSTLPSGSPLGNLPVDPSNTTSTGLFYTYTTDGSANYEVTALMESSKYKNQFNLNPTTVFFPGLVAKGNNLSLSELYSPVGLVGYWPLDEGSGTQAIDLSGNGNTGSWSGSTPYYTGGKIGAYGGSYNANNYTNLGTAASLSGLSQITVAIWFETTSSYQALATNQDLFSKHSNGTNGEWLLSPGNGSIAANNYITFFIVNTTPSRVLLTAQTPTVYNDGKWHFIVGTYNGILESLYYDGLLVGTTTQTGNIQLTTDVAVIGNLSSFLSPGWIGSADDARIYGRALSTGEIQALYTAGK